MSVHELLVLCGFFYDFVSKAYTLALIRAQTLKSYAKTVNLYNITFFRNKTPVAKLRFCESLFDQFLVIRMGFEPMTHSLEGCCSIQLSYQTDLMLKRMQRYNKK